MCSSDIQCCNAVLSSRAIGSDGFALFGTPGPGQYQTITQFNHGHLQKDGLGGKHVFSTRGKFSIQGKANTKEVAPDSPGPAAHKPEYSGVSPNGKPAVIGVATRAGEARRFVSSTTKPQIPDPVPGPGTYRNLCGRGHAKTIGDSAHAIIGTASRPPIYSPIAGSLPGAKYNLPDELGSGPHACIGPVESAAYGMTRDRMHEAMIHKTNYHGVGVVDATPKETPAPGAYSPSDAILAGNHASSHATFGKATKESSDKVCTRADLCINGGSGQLWYEVLQYVQHLERSFCARWQACVPTSATFLGFFYSYSSISSPALLLQNTQSHGQVLL